MKSPSSTLPWELLRRTAEYRPGSMAEDPELETILSSSSGRRLYCRVCHNLVTHEGWRLDVAGRHVHRRTNPAGIEFEFGCFEKAGGATAVGRPTAEHSWFGGYTWRYSICTRCASHLGWFFEGRNGGFHGLILERMEEDGDASSPPH